MYPKDGLVKVPTARDIQRLEISPSAVQNVCKRPQSRVIHNIESAANTFCIHGIAKPLISQGGFQGV